MGYGCEPFVDVYLPLLLKNTVVTIAVISASSNDAARAIITSAPTVKVLPRLLTALTDRSAIVRARAAEYMTLLLRMLPTVTEGERSPLERYIEPIAVALRSSFSDSGTEALAYCCYDHTITVSIRLL